MKVAEVTQYRGPEFSKALVDAIERTNQGHAHYLAALEAFVQSRQRR